MYKYVYTVYQVVYNLNTWASSAENAIEICKLQGRILFELLYDDTVDDRCFLSSYANYVYSYTYRLYSTVQASWASRHRTEVQRTVYTRTSAFFFLLAKTQNTKY